MLDNIVRLNRGLDASYEDDNCALLDEVTAMKSAGLDSFYDRLIVTNEFYQNYPSLTTFGGPKVEIKNSVQFSGEEVFGKYLDLHELYAQFSDICKRHSLDFDYIQY